MQATKTIKRKWYFYKKEKLKTAIEAYLQQFKDHQTNILTLT